MGYVTFQIGGDFRQHALLRGRRLEWKNSLQRLAYLLFPDAHRDSALAMFLLPAQRKRKLVVEKFLEDQSHLGGTAETVQQLQIFIFRRKMRVKHGFAARRKTVPFAQFFGQRIGNVAVEI